MESKNTNSKIKKLNPERHFFLFNIYLFVSIQISNDYVFKLKAAWYVLTYFIYSSFLFSSLMPTECVLSR